VRYPDATLPVFQQVCLCGAHTIRAKARAFDAGLKVQEEGEMDTSYLKRS
jgi:hypothetical protein